MKRKFLVAIVAALLAGTWNRWNRKPEIIEKIPDVSPADAQMIKTMKEAAKSFKICRDCPIQERCDTRLGCFFTYGPLGFLPLLPSTVPEIGTEFFAYTPDSPDMEHRILVDQPETFRVIDRNRQLAILIHGYTESYRSKVLVSLKNTILRYARDAIGTVIMVNWQHGCPTPEYLRASANTQVVGAQVSDLVNELIRKHFVDPRKVYLIGFSLGAHVAGHAGKHSQRRFGWRFGRITGCDAASPAFEGNPGSHLSRGDAEFVDAIHTASGPQVLGFESRYADLDFYPNGGNFQPGCHDLDIICSHRRSVQLFESSITGKFPGYPCCDYWEFKHGHHCGKWNALMGYPSVRYRNSTTGSLPMYLRTSGQFPYHL